MVASTALGTTFTYQGTLASAGVPANGSFDFTFALYDAATAGTQIGATLPRNGVAVQNGFFGVELDFGNVFTGTPRYIEIAVRPVDSGSFTTLTPRQAITPAPYALWAANAAHAQETWHIGEVTIGHFPYHLGAEPARWNTYCGNNCYYSFNPAPLTPKLVEAAHLLITDRYYNEPYSDTSPYTDTVTLQVDVRDYDGNLQRTLSTDTIDLTNSPLRQWISIPLTNDAAQLIVQPGEYLGITVNGVYCDTGNATECMDVLMALQAQVREP